MSLKQIPIVAKINTSCKQLFYTIQVHHQQLLTGMLDLK